MLVSKKEPKPIAVLCRNAPDGFQFILRQLKDDVNEYNFPEGRIVSKDGQVFFIVTTERQLHGMEISDFRIVPGFGWKNPDAEAIVATAHTRIRR